MSSNSVFIIAEAGVNHNGNLDLALALVDAAAKAGADAVKFQTFQAAHLVSAQAPKADYQKRRTDAGQSQLDMIRALELSQADHHVLAERCRMRGITFLSTPFDHPSLDFLVDGMGLKTLKLPSGEITNAPFLWAAARKCHHIILSTGMSTLDEVQTALAVLAHAWSDHSSPPGRAAFQAAWDNSAARARLAERLILLHCTTEYPTPFTDVNLRAMDALAQEFAVKVGYSDHTPGITAAIAAAARGAVVIEKHFTLDQNLPGPDHKASLEPDDLAAMVAGIRQVSVMLGDGVKRPAESEIKNMAVARKSLVALTTIRAGEPFTTANLGIKRPGSGVNPMDYWDWLGRVADRDYGPDDLI